ncbi:MAG: hypothetical protein H6Q84_2334, partial [Deltaproteobacteria bacterium]|nr:hypothetical protein [Deltaproteobacteria bacterium]
MKTRKMVLMLSIAFALFSGCQTIVYTHRDMSGPEATWGKPQIYIMRHNGTHQTNLSNRNRDEYSPDVRHDGKIVFLAGARQIYVMDIDGGNVAPVPNGPTDAGYPRWSRG